MRRFNARSRQQSHHSDLLHMRGLITSCTVNYQMRRFNALSRQQSQHSDLLHMRGFVASQGKRAEQS